MTANDKTGVGSGSGEWQTPPELFAALNRRFQFGYDAFASHENALCETYSMIDGTWARAGYRDAQARYSFSDRDGLSEPWMNRRVFCNPPYSRGFLDQAVAKMVEERNSAEIIVALLPAATDTRWFQLLMQHAHIDFLPKRVRFINPATGEPGNSPPSGHVIAVLKTDYM